MNLAGVLQKCVTHRQLVAVRTCYKGDHGRDGQEERVSSSLYSAALVVSAALAQGLQAHRADSVGRSELWALRALDFVRLPQHEITISSWFRSCCITSCLRAIYRMRILKKVVGKQQGEGGP